jgi:hypothetical protein
LFFSSFSQLKIPRSMGRAINVFKRGQIAASIATLRKNRDTVSVALLTRRHKASARTCQLVLDAIDNGDDPATVRRIDMDKARKAPSESKRARIQRQKAVVRLAKVVKSEAGRRTPCFSSAALIRAGLEAQDKVKASRSTVFRDLKRAGYKAYVRPVHPFDAKASAKKRVAFANKKLLMQPADAPIWKGLIFVDETFLDTNDRTGKTQYVPGGKQQQLVPRVVKNRFNVPHLQIFTSIGYNYKGPIVCIDGKKDEEGKVIRLNAQRYVSTCLSKMKQKLQQRGVRLVQDGARCHIAQSVMAYLQKSKIEVLSDWPAYSPDLNPIENMWKILGAEVSKRSAAVENVEQLKKIVVEAWNAMPMSVVNNLVMSFRNRLCKVRQSGGAQVVSSVKLPKKSGAKAKKAKKAGQA